MKCRALENRGICPCVGVSAKVYCKTNPSSVGAGETNASRKKRVTPMAYHRNMPVLLKMTMEEFQTLRSRLQLSQAEFARMLCVSVRTVQNWEQGRRSPTGPAAALLRIIDKESHAAIRALHGGPLG